LAHRNKGKGLSTKRTTKNVYYQREGGGEGQAADPKKSKRKIWSLGPSDDGGDEGKETPKREDSFRRGGTIKGVGRIISRGGERKITFCSRGVGEDYYRQKVLLRRDMTNGYRSKRRNKRGAFSIAGRKKTVIVADKGTQR